MHWFRSRAPRLVKRHRIDPIDFVRMIATTRIVLAGSKGPAFGGPVGAQPRGANPLHGRRGEFDFLWRSLADDAECRARTRMMLCLRRSRRARARQTASSLLNLVRFFETLSGSSLQSDKNVSRETFWSDWQPENAQGFIRRTALSEVGSRGKMSFARGAGCRS